MPLPDLTPDQTREWRALLLGEPGGLLLRKPVSPGFSGDGALGDEDKLSIQPDVDAFARLICLEATSSPLAIALFGAWGSGKTFFMRAVQKAIRKLCDEQRGGEQRADEQSGDAQRQDDYKSAFATEVRQIEFNAWTYSEKDLLASLAVEIFEKLLEHTTGVSRYEADELEQNSKLIARLETARAAKEQQKQDVATAESERDTAKGMLNSAKATASEKRRELEDAKGKIALEVLRQKALDPNDPVHGTLQQLGLGAVAKNAADLIELRDQTAKVTGRMALLYRRLISGKGAGWPFVLLLVGVAALALIPLLFDEQNIQTFWLQVSAALGGFVAWGKTALGKVEELLGEVEKTAAAYDAELAARQAEIDASVITAQSDVDKAELAVSEKQAVFEKLEQYVLALEMEQKLSGAMRLTNFIQQRANSDDYRQHLGIVRQLRDDFEELSRLMKKRRQSTELAKEIPQIDRIVLYIDDLDRCKPSTVKKVLEAVHLLLSVDLFVVVVGVDEKWVSRSLSSQYGELLREPDDAEKDEAGSSKEGPPQATSADFVEKIFQIPFWLTPMSRDDIRGYVDSLLGDQIEAVPEETQNRLDDITEDIDNTSLAASRLERRDLDQDAKPLPEDFSRAAIMTAPTEIREPVEDLDSVSFTADEVAFLKTLGPLIGRTPRSAKRYFNLYRLIRARLQGGELREFLGRGSPHIAPAYPLVQLLLAYETNHHNFAEAVESGVRNGRLGGEETPISAKEFSNIVNEIADAPSEPQTVDDLTRGMHALITYSDDKNLPSVAYWARIVARYSFRRSGWLC